MCAVGKVDVWDERGSRMQQVIETCAINDGDIAIREVDSEWGRPCYGGCCSVAV